LQAFDGYAAETAVSEIFGGEIENLRGLGLLFKYQIFLYAFFVMALLSLIVLILTEAQNARKPRRAFESEISST
jgi:LMBR1 domain-containing protein 1